MRLIEWVAAAVLVATVADPAWAQTAPAAENVEVDPITCWWRSSAAAVRSGEPFALTLTCAVVATESTTVVPDLSKLDPAVVQLPPFEVIGGSHAADLVTAGTRFLQYEYQLRLINEMSFGADVDVPQLQITYRIESKVAQGGAVQGRDLNYNLQPISIRLLSVVPSDTQDIREAPVAAFQAVEAREARADLLKTIAGVLLALAAVLLLAMMVTLVRRRPRQATTASWLMADRAILGRARRELADVRQHTRGGWTDELAGRALAALRIAGSYDAGRPVGQARPKRGAVPLDGQLAVNNMLGASTWVSGAATGQSQGTGDLADSLRTLTSARYGRSGTLDSATLDDALDAGTRATKRVASHHSVLATWWRSVLDRGRSLNPFGNKA